MAPRLRFPEFNDGWSTLSVQQIVNRVSDSVEVVENEEYQEIGIRSHGKGIFYKEPILGKSIGNKRVFWVKEGMFIVNIVFAWEQAVAKTTEKEVGMIASHRFPMYEPIKGVLDLDYILYFFLTKRGKHLLGLASPGGAGRNKTLGQKAFEELKFKVPSIEEQQKIATFLTAVDSKIQQLTKKKALLEQYKKGVMQRIFKQEIRFKDENGEVFPEWEEKRLGEIATPIKKKAKGLDAPILTISAGNGFLNQMERFSKIIAGTSLSKYNIIKKDEFSYNRGNSKSFQYGCIYRLKNYDKALVPFVYRSFKISSGVPGFFEQLFLYKYLDRQLRKMISSSARMDGLLNISEKDFYKVKVIIPSHQEQAKVSSFLAIIDQKIDQADAQLEQLQQFKKGLLQKMFV